MIICGDVSVPNEECGRRLLESMIESNIFANQTVVMNLEGVLLADNPSETFWKVYNDKSILNLKNICSDLIFGLANNHIYDYPEQIRTMLSMLNDTHIPYFGLAEADGSFKPLEFEADGVLYAIFGHCWEVYTRTNKNNRTSDKVVDCTYRNFYKSVIEYMNQHSSIKVICFFHWNFDMEKYTFPAYKKLAHDLIDYGVEAVIGNHSHCQQEVEIYNGKVIAYGLGNFYMPDGYFFNGTLKYPVESHNMCVVEISKSGVCIHEFETDTQSGSALSLIKTYNLSRDIGAKSSKEKYDEEAYESFFKRNRVKKKITPIFYTYDNSLENILKTDYCILKIAAIRTIKQMIDRNLRNTNRLRRGRKKNECIVDDNYSKK